MYFFGNPEIKRLILLVFDDADAGSKVYLNFQGCHIFFITNILLKYGPPEIRITYFLFLINIMQNRFAFNKNCLRNLPCNFSVLKQ